jgi:hypothetical protein
MSVQSFADSPRIEFDLDDYLSRWDLINAISFPLISGTTNTAAALDQLRQIGFLTENGGRPDARNVVVLITDGHSNNRTNTWDSSVALRNEEVTIVTLGFGITSQYDIKEMNGLTSDPDDLNFHNVQLVNGTYDVTAVADRIMESICTGEGLFRQHCNIVSATVFADVDSCTVGANPCGNGRCIDMFNGYRCECDDGFSGAGCDKSKRYTGEVIPE